MTRHVPRAGTDLRSLRLFGDEDEIRWLEADLPSLGGETRRAALARLAWYLRQRDTKRALALAAEASSVAGEVPPSLAARLALVRSEGARLFGRHEEAGQEAQRAIAAFAATNDLRGLGDAHLAYALVANDRGAPEERDSRLASAADVYRNAGDASRADYVEARRAIDDAFRDPVAAQSKWAARIAELEGAADDATLARIEEFRAWSAFSRSEFARAAPLYLRAYEHALASGQWPMAVMELTNAGAALAELNDHAMALEHLDRGLELARAGAWPGSIAVCLVQAANSSRELGRHEAAAGFLAEALQVLEPLKGGRLHAIALQYQGDLALARGDAKAAIPWYDEFEARARALGSPDLLAHALSGRARALAAVGDAAAAKACALEALELSEEMKDGVRQVAALRALAAQEDLSDSAGRKAAREYLERAIEVGKAVSGYLVPGELIADLAAAHAAQGEFERAYALSVEAARAQATAQGKRATDKMLALEVRHETDRATLEAAQERRTSRILAQLSRVGQELMGNLEIEDTMAALAHDLGSLLDAAHVAIWDIDRERGELHLRHGFEDEKPLPEIRVPLSDPHAYVARCAREKREILVRTHEKDTSVHRIPGGRKMATALFGPLHAGDRVTGVLSIQSTSEDAYGERERLIFGSLCAYGAVALSNAETYRRLKLAQQMLEEASLTDPLTALRNRRYLMQHIGADVSLCLRHHELRAGRAADRDLIFFLVDLDHFKQVNDAYGHAAGDALLRQMRERFAGVFRESDHLVRWGGEEFLVVAREANRQGAAELAERLRRAVAERPFRLDDGRELAKTCSIGVAAFPFLPDDPSAIGWESVVEIADLALYTAKNSGRDTWVILQPSTHASARDLMQRIKQGEAAALKGGRIEGFEVLRP